MYKVTIIGNGNLGTRLFYAIEKSKYFSICQWYARNWEKNKIDKKTTKNLKKLKSADIYIIAVSDNSISKILKHLNKNCFVIHCSGVTSIKIFKGYNSCGVMYPIQTISKENRTEFKNIPFCVETKKNNEIILLNKLVKSIGGIPEYMRSDKRIKLHLAAVWVNNFINHMILKGKKICDNNQIPFSILKPLINETISTALINNPKEIQTGPARRNDKNTLKIHSMLLSESNDKKLYKILTKSIQNEYEYQ